MTTMIDLQTHFELYHYKNSIFQGYISNFKREGEGICIFDNKAVLLGNFKNDQLNNQSLIIIHPQTYFLGGFKRGMLDGPFVIRSPQFVIYSQTNMNTIQGEILVIDKKQTLARLWEIQNSEAYCIKQISYGELHLEQMIMKAISPYTEQMPTLLEFFMQKMTGRFHIKMLKGKDKFEVCLEAKSMRKMTIQFDRERLISYGVIQNGVIMGLGYLYDQASQTEIQGEIEKTYLNGEGTKKDLASNKTIYGKFHKGDIRSLDVLSDQAEIADSSLNKLKKKHHIHSLDYVNDYMNERPIYLIRNFYQAIVQNENTYSVHKRQSSSKNLTREMSIIGLTREASSDELTYSIREYNLINNALKNIK